MGKKEWRESSSGPDVLDVMVILRAIETLHDVHCAVIITPEQNGVSSGCDIALSALMETLPRSELAAGIGVHSAFPNGRGTTLWGECYRLAWLLDEEIGKAYKQKSLLET